MQFASPTWMTGPAGLDGGRIVIDDPQAPELEDIYGGMRTVFDLAGVRSPHEAVAFASKYGLLRSGGVDRETGGRIAGETYNESYADWLIEISTLNMLMAQYIELRIAHDEDVKPTEEAWEAALDELYGPIAEKAQNLYVQYVGFYIFTTDTLIDMLYYHLGELIENDRIFRYCQDCGRVFLVGHLSQQFCNNTCASRTRYHRRAARQREMPSVVDASENPL